MATLTRPPMTTTRGLSFDVTQEAQMQQYMPKRYTPPQRISQTHLVSDFQPQTHQSQARRPEMMPFQQPFASPTRSDERTSDDAYKTTMLRPSMESNPSYASHRSTRSHKSNHSVTSHRSTHSSGSHRSSRSHHSDHEPKDRRRTKGLEERPTMGDSVLLVWHHLKDALIDRESKDHRSHRR